MQGKQVVLVQNVAAQVAKAQHLELSSQVNIQNTTAVVVLLGGPSIAGASTAGWQIPASGSVQLTLAPGDALWALCTIAGGATLNVLVSP